ncbi:signal peptide peptidase SppA [Mycolicibacterium insubricum]|mgnify:CR=1 FL=1|uniref:Signal peptide peptidase SppA n=1 Tax=Mycolicibacterium insubricum TaxID=444597 RepID=A0A1X0DBW6_9MYCO|nr:signal peptide peptidase SppA [Mycolicibacterium insubricum]ORA69883.1 signal peptide peptidase SppA [Mycolicibacterium insubricum]BBZ65958.1 signal peptide peptidase SppA [Mycolicibacterium insubricum]
MLSLLSGLPGSHDLKALARRVDTARHHGIPAGVVLELDLTRMPAETAGFDPVTALASLAGAKRPLVLRETIAAIERAAADDRVAGLIARVQLEAAAPGAVQELRAAIAAFSAVKPSLAWAESYPGTLSYYLASAFGEVWMQPSGTVGLIGFATSKMFLRNALDKAGIEAEFITTGEYKSAAAMFTEDGYTPAHREADTRLLESVAEQVWAGVAESRGIDIADLDALADRAPILRDDAVAANLVDRIGFRDQAYARIAELTGTEATDPDDEDAPDRLFLARYARAGKSELPTPPIPGRGAGTTIAVVNVVGPIVSGRGDRTLLPLGESSAGGDTIAAALRTAAATDGVAAIVLRVDSPGGSVSASETIWREVVRARERGIPVVASMGAVAASGGYYVSMSADAIVANPATITGSIGVITGKLNARDLKDRLGIGSDGVRTNANADAWSLDAPFTEQQHAQIAAEADLLYDDFVQRVADGRGLGIPEVQQVARGRVWTGADAQARGLVDELGGLQTAIRRAKVLAGLDPDKKVKVVELPGGSLRDMLRPKASSRPAAGLTELLSNAVVGSVTGMIDGAQRQLTGTTALWLGQARF